MRKSGTSRRGLWLGRALLAITMLGIALPAGAAGDRAVKSKVPAVYPELAKRLKITGVVKVEATVDSDGKVTAAKTLSGNSALLNAAEDAVKKWKFAPGDGTTTVDVDVNFTIGGQ